MAQDVDGLAPIIKRKKVVAGDGHHGGAWKVAYADFVTAMMAFFLLMWLLNATTERQRKGLADYFAPTIAVSLEIVSVTSTSRPISAGSRTVRVRATGAGVGIGSIGPTSGAALGIGSTTGVGAGWASRSRLAT